MISKDKQIKGKSLKEAVLLYSTGDFNKIQLSKKSKKDRRLFCENLQIFFDQEGWSFNEQTARQWIESKKTKKDGSQASLASQRRYIAQLRAFNSFCIQRGYLTVNFCQWIAKPAEHLTIKEIPDLSFEIVLEAIKLGTTPSKGDRSRSIFIKNESFEAMLFCLFTARRSGEMASLRGEDIHTEAEDPYYASMLKGGARKNFPIPNNLIEMMTRRQKNEKAFSVTPITTIKHFRNGLRACGVSEEVVMQCNNHTFRKLFAKEKYRNGEDISKIADVMADKMETVKKYYLGEDLEAMKKTVNNSKYIRKGKSISDLMNDATEDLRIIFEDYRFEMPRLLMNKGTISFDVDLTEEGLEEMKKR